ncbi:type I-C CRISPR-associated protein Cas5c [soil metagenome]
MRPPTIHVLEVWGDFACFTSPMKVERWSYPVITPSAARGIFDAIYVKPTKFRWQIDRIEVLREPKTIALRRNEVKEKGPSDSEVREWASGQKEIEPIFVDATEPTKGRTQRQTMALQNVRYRIHAHIVRWPDAMHDPDDFDTQFVRRAEHGKCAFQPCFGMREFPAYFELAKGDAECWDGNLDLGWMLYDVFDLGRPGTKFDSARVSLFRAEVRDGVLEVPPYESEAVRKGVPRK